MLLWYEISLTQQGNLSNCKTLQLKIANQLELMPHTSISFATALTMCHLMEFNYFLLQKIPRKLPNRPPQLLASQANRNRKTLLKTANQQLEPRPHNNSQRRQLNCRMKSISNWPICWCIICEGKRRKLKVLYEAISFR